MSLLQKDTYCPPVWLPGGHFQTIFPTLFRTVEGVNYQREQIILPDSDFLNLDWSYVQLNVPKYDKPLCVVTHGFEGDSRRQYIIGMVRAINQIGLDCLAWNFRSCGGTMNKQPRFYHSGAIEDLDEVVKHATRVGYKQIILIGFSLGGNLTLTYLGKRPAKEVILGTVFSVPLDLKACSLHIGKFENRIYEKRFLKTLAVKIQEKHAQYPELIDISKWRQVNSVYSFDDVYTAPLHGFKDADDYYVRCSSQHYIGSIKVPTLIVNAANDPMIPLTSIPLKQIQRLDKVALLLTKQGGHCGYRQMSVKDNIYWSEQIAVDFIREKLS